MKSRLRLSEHQTSALRCSLLPVDIVVELLVVQGVCSRQIRVGALLGTLGRADLDSAILLSAST